MPSKGDTQINNFVGGLITEASPLTFPPNASIDEINFKLKRDGSRERRLGLDFEEDYTLHSTGLTAAQMPGARQTFFHWPTPNGNTEVDIGIIQVGSLLFFVDLFTANPSSNLLNSGNSIDLGLPSDAKLSYAIINNKVAVVSASLDVPFLLSYEDSTDTVSVVSGAIKIRDLYGVNDGLEAGERPTTLTVNHEYNLRNQGWSKDIVTVSGAEILQDTFNSIGEYPSNSDTWSLGKIADVTDADIDKYDPETLQKNSFDIGRSARGHFIIDAFTRGQSRNTESGLTLTSSDRDLGRLSTVESYAGRLFYSGVTSKVVGGDTLSPNLSGAVFYSQIARSDADLLKCYQEADPTSPTSNDAVDSDGGVIQISGAVDIVKLKTIKTSLFVFASNGIWQIRGDDGGFRATSLQVNKISSIGVFSPESIVEANGTIFFWAESGIYSLTPNQVDSTTFDSTNVTLTTIQRGYNSIPDLLKKNAKGYYDLNENKVRWLYRSDVPETLVVPDPPAPTTELGAITELATNRQQPLFAKASSTTAVMLYRDTPSTQMYYKVLSVSGTTITAGTEATVKASSAITSMAIVGLTDNRVLVVYRDAASGTTTNAMVGTVSGDTVTFGTPVALGTTFTGDLGRGLYELRKISDTRILFGSVNTVNQTPTLQVIDVTAGDVITFGAIATSSLTNRTTVKLALLGASDGILASGAATSNTAAFAEHYTISGTTVTFNGTQYVFTNTTQYPTESDQFFIGDLVEISSTQAFLHGAATVDTTHGWSAMILTNSGGVITSTTVLLETNFASSASNAKSSILHISDQIAALLIDNNATPDTIDLGLYTKGATPTRTLDGSLLDTQTNLDHANSIAISDTLIIQGYTITSGTPAVWAVAHNIT